MIAAIPTPTIKAVNVIAKAIIPSFMLGLGWYSDLGRISTWIAAIWHILGYPSARRLFPVGRRFDRIARLIGYPC